MPRFLLENARWLGAGFLLTFASAFGQTWFISLFAGHITEEYGLSDGGWGSLYTVSTLAAAGLMFWRGSLADSVRLVRLALAVGLLFAAAAAGMALGGPVWALGLSIFLLRFCGQGMFGHIAMTAMGRWFEARRGRAVALSGLGHSAGEMVIPLGAVAAIAWLGWRGAWALTAAVIAFAVVPALVALLSRERAPQGIDAGGQMPGLAGRHWGRRDAARHWLLPALLPVILTPGFLGTVIFFHQVHIAEVKGWTLVQMAPGYTAWATMTIAAALVGGWAADRFGPHRLLPVLLVPLGLGIGLIGPAGHVATWYLALGLAGLTQGAAGALWGAFLPAVYGTRYLGSVRSLVTTVMVVSTAIGPGLTGVLIDWGVDFPRQSIVFVAWCVLLSGGCAVIERRLDREMHARPAAA
jgi:MFS family permease